MNIFTIQAQQSNEPKTQPIFREVSSLNESWQFMKYADNPDDLIYDVRPKIEDTNDAKVADSKPTEAIVVASNQNVLKNWILPTANEFIKEDSKKHLRPEGNPGSDFPFVQNDFNDSQWQEVNLPHDWAITGPFYSGENPEVGGGMGRLPSHGVAWYRKKIELNPSDKNKIIYLDIDGAMSYAMVWLNGHLVGGWPYGYNSFRLNLSPYLRYDKPNQLAIRLDNPNHAARWYPGGGLYRNVWLTKVALIHIAHWGSFITTPEVSPNKAILNFELKVQNNTPNAQTIRAQTTLYETDVNGKKIGKKIDSFPIQTFEIEKNTNNTSNVQLTLENPKLWGVFPKQKQNLYLAYTELFQNNTLVDTYETKFGIRKIEFDANLGLIVNGEKIKIQGVNQHHDLGALGAAFNVKAAQRQLELLRELGCNAIRLAHNPPAPEFLELTDKMGFLVINEIFDSWQRKKTPLDFHLIFDDWHEADTRSFVRRDRNHPSVIAWSFGNEVGEQYTDKEGAKIAKKLHNIVHEEDPTRPASASQNFAKPDMPFSNEMDFISLNYQGEGIRNAPAYAHLTNGIRTKPLYDAFHQTFPHKIIVSSETASALSSRGSYIFPVTTENSAPVSDTTGGNPKTKEVSAYELYTAQFGSSPDKVFATQDKHPFVAGEFVWSGWDYLGEPTPYYSAKSSYCGIIDLAGFKKDRFYLYQSRWRPDLPLAHILPHWNWPDQIGKVTPVHVFTSGDEAELFLNGKSLGRKKKQAFEYRLRWDDVVYQPGKLEVVSFRKDKKWASETIETTDDPNKIMLSCDTKTLQANGEDLAFITVKVMDKKDRLVPNAQNKLIFSIEGPGEIVATDNGNPSDLTAFSSFERNAFNGLALVIVRAKKDQKGIIKLRISSENLEKTRISIPIK
nr:beta-galactosidase GalB [Flavobacterium agrisoli]